MPMYVDKLTPDSSKKEIQAAISESVSACVKEGSKSREECVAIAIGNARKSTGSGAGSLGGRRIRAGLEEERI